MVNFSISEFFFEIPLRFQILKNVFCFTVRRVLFFLQQLYDRTVISLRFSSVASFLYAFFPSSRCVRGGGGVVVGFFFLIYVVIFLIISRIKTKAKRFRCFRFCFCCCDSGENNRKNLQFSQDINISPPYLDVHKLTFRNILTIFDVFMDIRSCRVFSFGFAIDLAHKTRENSTQILS